MNSKLYTMLLLIVCITHAGITFGADIRPKLAAFDVNRFKQLTANSERPRFSEKTLTRLKTKPPKGIYRDPDTGLNLDDVPADDVATTLIDTPALSSDKENRSNTTSPEKRGKKKKKKKKKNPVADASQSPVIAVHTAVAKEQPKKPTKAEIIETTAAAIAQQVFENKPVGTSSYDRDTGIYFPTPIDQSAVEPNIAFFNYIKSVIVKNSSLRSVGRLTDMSFIKLVYGRVVSNIKNIREQKQKKQIIAPPTTQEHDTRHSQTRNQLAQNIIDTLIADHTEYLVGILGDKNVILDKKTGLYRRKNREPFEIYTKNTMKELGIYSEVHHLVFMDEITEKLRAEKLPSRNLDTLDARLQALAKLEKEKSADTTEENAFAQDIATMLWDENNNPSDDTLAIGYDAITGLDIPGGKTLEEYIINALSDHKVEISLGSVVRKVRACIEEIQIKEARNMALTIQQKLVKTHIMNNYGLIANAKEDAETRLMVEETYTTLSDYIESQFPGAHRSLTSFVHEFTIDKIKKTKQEGDAQGALQEDAIAAFVESIANYLLGHNHDVLVEIHKEAGNILDPEIGLYIPKDDGNLNGYILNEIIAHGIWQPLDIENIKSRLITYIKIKTTESGSDSEF